MEIKIITGDITTMETQAIVNAANSSLLGGGGVDGAIHRAGGKQILEECRQIRNRQGKCKVGEAVITNAGNMNAEKVIHTVGPRWNNGKSNEDELLAACYTNTLKLAEAHHLTSIAFPNISTGIYRFPKERAARIAFSVVKEYPYQTLETVVFVCYDEENYNIYQSLL